MTVAAAFVRVRELMRRFDRVITYGVVGGGLALIQLVLTAAFVQVGRVTDPSVASVLASAITIPLSFWAHKRTTYADVARQRFQAMRFAATACSSVIIAAGTIKLTQIAGDPFWFGLVLGSALVPVGNFAINALWVFRTKTFFSIGERAP